MIPTDSHIPAPTGTKYPFATMQVGDSFEIPQGGVVSCRSLASRRSVDGKRFVVRKYRPEGRLSVFRCWRLE